MFKLGLVLLVPMLLYAERHPHFEKGVGWYGTLMVVEGWLLTAPIRRALWGSSDAKAEQPVVSPTDTRQPRRRPALGDERPAASQKRLDEAAQAVTNRAYRKAFPYMDYERYEAARRGDTESLETLLSLAKRIQEAPEAHARIRTRAHEFAERLHQMRSSFAEPESVEAQDG